MVYVLGTVLVLGLIATVAWGLLLSVRRDIRHTPAGVEFHQGEAFQIGSPYGKPGNGIESGARHAGS